MLIEATHTADGHRLDLATEAMRPFIAWLDEPATADVAVYRPVLRCRGWAVARSGSPLRVTAAVRNGAATQQKVLANLPRPDVASTLSHKFPIRGPECGFNLVIPLPEQDEAVPVVVRVDDGTHSGQAEILVRRDTAPARSDYKSTWESVATDVESAERAVAGYNDERELQRTAKITVQTLQETTTLRTDDMVLEIGAGVGRVGPEIAPLVRRWIATDVSSNMLRHARERCAEFDNVEFVELSGWDLEPIPDESVDLVYCTVVFMHLEEWERFSYIREAMRVLRRGGRVYVDNVNLRSDQGWDFFIKTLDDYHPLDRPPNVSKTSTADELRAYLQRAGFVHIGCSDDPVWLWTGAWGTKP
jgi:ubiquinone/menaquinone biosynthesis C-methylase UbiE